MRARLIRSLLVSASIAVGALTLGPTSALATPEVTTDPATGNVTVTLEDGTNVLVPAALVAQITAAMNSGDPAAVTAAIKALVAANAAHDANLATAIYILALNATSDPALRAAAYAGTVAGNPDSQTQVAANSPSGTGGNAGGEGGGGNVADNGFPDGGTSGGGSSPSIDNP